MSASSLPVGGGPDAYAMIMGRLTAVFRDVFGDDSIELSSKTNAADIPDWDSMANVTLAVEIEHTFGIRIKTAQMEDLREVGDMVAMIQEHLARSAKLS